MGQITVRYFAAAADAAGRDEEPWEVAAAPTLGSLRDDLVARYGADMQRVLCSGSFLVDGTVRTDDGAVEVPADGQVTVDVLPAFAGG